MKRAILFLSVRHPMRIAISFCIAVFSAGVLAQEAEVPRHVRFQRVADAYARLVQETADELAVVADEKTAISAAAQLKRAVKQAQGHVEKVREIGYLTADDNKKFSSKSFDAAGKRHTEASRKCKAFLDKKTLSPATDTLIREALLEWASVNFALSEATGTILRKGKGK